MTFTWPKELSKEDEMLLATGALVTAAASLEFFFYVVLQCLTERDGQRHCEAIWLSHRSTRSRIDMVLAAARLNHLDPALLAEIEECAAHMKGISKLRNYYGHARFVRRDGSAMYEGFALASETEIKAGADPVRTTIKMINPETFKELKDAVNRAGRLYERMLGTAHRLRAHAKALHVELPTLA
jgi:hypothetical protein